MATNGKISIKDYIMIFIIVITNIIAGITVYYQTTSNLEKQILENRLNIEHQNRLHNLHLMQIENALEKIEKKLP